MPGSLTPHAPHLHAYAVHLCTVVAQDIARICNTISTMYTTPDDVDNKSRYCIVKQRMICGLQP